MPAVLVINVMVTIGLGRKKKKKKAAVISSINTTVLAANPGERRAI